jgi:hypothetical protein
MANEFSSFDVVGKKEDVSDIISNITPTKAPFTSLTKSESVHNTVFQWQEDVLRDPAANAQVEGFTATNTARTPTVMRSNVTQIMQDTFAVTGTNDAISKYGRGKESAREAAKAAAALKLDLEAAFTLNDAAQVTPANISQAGVFAGVQRQIAAANIVKTGGVGTLISEAKYLDAAQAALHRWWRPDHHSGHPDELAYLRGLHGFFGQVPRHQRWLQDHRERREPLRLAVR